MMQLIKKNVYVFMAAAYILNYITLASHTTGELPFFRPEKNFADGSNAKARLKTQRLMDKASRQHLWFVFDEWFPHILSLLAD